ncbi:MAG: modA [Hyphomicrobiales bacterium]|nr:modA [Hyphomicrobiales bacterium]
MLRLKGFSLAVGVVALGLAAAPAVAGQTHVAVAANFTDAAKEIAAAFRQKTGHEAVLSFGSSGQLYTQITQEAPFQILLSADDARPKKLVEDGSGVASSRFTYAIGKLVLWSRTPAYVKGEDTLKAATYNKISIANPTAAPYGAAAIEAMKSVGIYEKIQPKIVQGNSIAQAFQFIDSGNAELGFIAASQLAGNESGSRWMVPQALYTPIRQDAVLLKRAETSEAAVAFMAFLKSPDVKAIVQRFGYASDTGS